jgi:hypothetical protein
MTRASRRKPRSTDQGVVARAADIEGTRMHYLTAGRGAPHWVLEERPTETTEALLKFL